MLILLARTIILYFLVILVMRLMGKRQIGELQPYEFVITIMISDLALLPMQDVKLPLLLGIVPILTLLLLKLGLSQLQLKSQFARKIIDGEPAILVYKSKIRYTALKNQQINLDELMEELRLAGYFDLEEIQYAILETNGDISILPNQVQSAESQPSSSQSFGSQNVESQNSRDRNYGAQNSGSQNSNTQNNESISSDSQNTSNQASGSQNSGTQTTSNQISDSQHTGSQNAETQNLQNKSSNSKNNGTKNTGSKNPKSPKSKSKKSSASNSKVKNSGSKSSASQNTGSQNTESQNTGSQNAGAQNTGSQTMSGNPSSNEIFLPKILVCDGKINKNSLTKVNQDAEWIKNKLKENGIDDMKKVLIAFFDTQGNFKYQLFDKYTKENTQNEK